MPMHAPSDTNRRRRRTWCWFCFVCIRIEMNYCVTNKQLFRQPVKQSNIINKTATVYQYLSGWDRG